jgi:hypothetical protein
VPVHPIMHSRTRYYSSRNPGHVTMLSTHLLQALSCGFFSSYIPTKTFHALIFHPMHATWPSHLTNIDFIIPILFGEYMWWSSLLRGFLQPPITYFPLGPLFSCCSLNAMHQVSHPYWTRWVCTYICGVDIQGEAACVFSLDTQCPQGAVVQGREGFLS